MHYFRLPHQDLWRDRLQKLKAGGYNTVDIYFNWAYHEKSKGVWDFSGPRNITRLLEYCAELDLMLIARPGPYINAELACGGLPTWLIFDEAVIPRHRKNNAHHWCQAYQDAVDTWYNTVIPYFKDYPKLLMVQVENEYATDDLEPEYLDRLIHLVRAHGITAPTMHNDFYAGGLYEEKVDIYAIDNYAITTFDDEWEHAPHTFSVIDHMEKDLRPNFCENRPLMIAELQAGWFAGWYGAPYSVIHQKLGRKAIGTATRSFLAQGGTVFNHYLAIGGTNSGYLGATDVCNSYDFAAPITETGLPSVRFYEAKRINQLLQHFDLSQTDRIENTLIPEHASIVAIRKETQHQGYWIFLRHLGKDPEVLVPLHESVKARLEPGQSVMLPFNYPLDHTVTLVATATEVLASIGKTLFVCADTPVSLMLENMGPFLGSLPSGVLLTPLLDQRITIKATHLTTPAVLHFQNINVVLLNDPDTFWVGKQMVWLGPDWLLTEPNGEEIPICLPSTDSQQILQGPSFAEHFVFEPCSLQTDNLMETPCLGPWKLSACGAEIQQRPFKGVGDIATMEAHGIVEQPAWYQLIFHGAHHKTLTFLAGHIWAVALNGVWIHSGETFPPYPQKLPLADPVTMALPSSNLRDENSLLFFTESLGHHKGFYDDAHEPRGIFSLHLDDQDVTRQLGIQPVCYLESTLPTGLWQASSYFDYTLPPRGVSLSLHLSQLTLRIDVWLNDILVGKLWQGKEDHLYLPEGLLQQGNNRLRLVIQEFSDSHLDTAALRLAQQLSQAVRLVWNIA
jgi:hypothetical protein